MKPKKKSTIMIADDEPDILIILGEFLKEEGFTVITARDGTEVLEKLKTNHVDLLLLDMAMPKMNGIETLREIRKTDTSLSVIMITAYRDAEKVVDSFRMGAYDCIFKPFDLKYLRQAIMAKLIE